MAEPQVITTLREKRNHIEQSLKAYEAKAEQCRRDLAHVNATLALFAADRDSDPAEVRSYMDTSRLFRRGDLSGLCKAALASHGSQDTRELARRVAGAMLQTVPSGKLTGALRPGRTPHPSGSRVGLTRRRAAEIEPRLRSAVGCHRQYVIGH